MAMLVVGVRDRLGWELVSAAVGGGEDVIRDGMVLRAHTAQQADVEGGECLLACLLADKTWAWGMRKQLDSNSDCTSSC